MSRRKFLEESNKNLVMFNAALEYFEEIEYCEDKIVYEPVREEIRPLELNNLLRNEMLLELDNLKEIFSSNSEIREMFEKSDDPNADAFYNFIMQFSRCPICNGFNHFKILKDIYYSEEYQDLVKNFLNLMKNEKLDNLNIEIGIPCCVCFNVYLQDKE